MGCSLIGGAVMDNKVAALAEKPADVAYKELENPGYLERQVYVSTLGIDPAQFNASVKNTAEQNLSVNNTPDRAFNEMIEELSGRLAATIPNSPEIKNSPNRKFLAVGEFKNDTGISGGRVSHLVQSVADRLVNNTAITNEFDIQGIEATSANDILTSIAGPDYEKVFQNADGSNFRDVRLKRFHPQDVYVLSGSVFRLPDYDQGVPRMTMSTKVRLQHPRTGVTVLAEEFSRNYIYHPARKSWLSEAENEALRAQMNEKETKKN